MKIRDFQRGWFVGKFSPSLWKADHEVGLRWNDARDAEERHYHKKGTEYIVFAGGQHKLNGQTYCDGEMAIIYPYMSSDYECIAPGYCLTVRNISDLQDKYFGHPLNIVIPMAGKGQRFKDAGYKEPKAMIKINGKPMIDRVIANLEPKRDHRVLLVTREEISPENKNVQQFKLDHETDGAVSTMLEVEHLIGREDPLLIANCDQLLLNFNVNDFMEKAADCSVTVFSSDVPHHSYVEFDTTYIDHRLKRTAEKEVISNLAVGGVYFFRKAKYYFDAARRMIEQDIRVNGEFYNTPVFNEIIGRYKVNTYLIKHEDQQILGTPKELEMFNKKLKAGVIRL